MASSFARTFAAVTKSDSTLLDFAALYVGTGGDVVLVGKSGASPVTFANVPSGYILPCSGTKVMAATTASNIVALS